MVAINWNSTGKRSYEAGLDRVVLYTQTSDPVPWFGFRSYEESISGGEAEPYYIDGIKYQTQIGSQLFPDIDFIFKTNTVYFFETSGLTEQQINVIKYEAEMGISEPTKMEKEIFIERQSISVFERHMRIGEIGTIEELEQYKNGYYNIFNIE